MRLVLDTNVLVAAIRSDDGRVAAAARGGARREVPVPGLGIPVDRV
jgi:hypothetical protein